MNASKTTFSGYNSADGSALAGKSQGPRASFFGLIQWFIVQFLQSIPFSVQVFLRKNRGSMTFSWAKVFFAALWVRFILDGTYQLDQLHPPETFMYEWFNKGNGAQYYFAVGVWYIGIFFAQFANVVTNFLPSALKETPLSSQEILPFLISVGIIVYAIIRKWKIKRMHDRRIIFDPMDKGKSILFEKVLDRMNPKDRSLYLALLEMAFLFGLAIITYLLSFENAEWFDYTGFLAFGAIGIGIEEWRSLQQKRKEMEFRFANEFKARDLQETYSQYQKDVSLKPATVSFIAFSGAPTIYMPTSVAVPLNNRQPFIDKIHQLSHKYLLLALVIIGILITAFTLTRGEDIQEVGLVQTENLTVRKQPKLGAVPKGTIKKGTVVKIIKCGIFDQSDREWCKVIYNDGEKGYSAALGAKDITYLWHDPISFYSYHFFDVPFEDVILTDAGSNLNLRQYPSTNAPIVTQIPAGKTVTILDEASEAIFLEVDDELIFGSWCLIRYGESEGYCFSWYLESCRIPNFRDPWE